MARPLHPFLWLFLAVFLHTATRAQQFPSLGEFKVNRTVAGNQQHPCIASDAAGDFVVVWESDGEDGSGLGIYWQLFNSAGSPVRGPFRVNSVTQNDQLRPAVAMNPRGEFVIVWEDNFDSGSYRVKGQRFDVGGIERGTNFDIFTATTGEAYPAVAMNNDDRFVVVRRAIGQPHDPSEGGIIAQLYHFSTGVPDGPQIGVNDTGTDFDQTLPNVAMNASGAFVIAWRGQDSSDTGVFAKLFREDGTATPVFSASTTHQDEQAYPSVAIADDRSFVIAFESGLQNTYDVRAARFDANATMIGGADFLVSRSASGAQYDPSIAMDPSGAFTVAYTSDTFDGDGHAVVVQHFTADGMFDGNELPANSYRTGDQLMNASGRGVATDAQGNFVVVWFSASQDGSGFGVYADKFYLPNQGPPLSEFRVNTTTALDQKESAVASDAAGNFTVVWTSDTAPGGTDSDIFGQQFDNQARKLGPEFRVNTQASGRQFHPSISMAPDGRFVVVWASENRDGNGLAVVRRLFSKATISAANGGPSGEPNDQQINITTEGDQDFPSVAMRSDGQFVVAWEDESYGTNSKEITAQRYNAAGVPLGNGTPFRVNRYTIGVQAGPSVAINNAGRFAIAWSTAARDNNPDGTLGTDVAAVVLNFADASVIPPPGYDGNGYGEFNVNTYADKDEDSASVTLDDAGNLAVAWCSNSTTDGEGAGLDIFMRRFTSALNPVEAHEIRVNADPANDQVSPQLARTSNGDLLAVWVGANKDGSGTGVFHRRIKPNDAFEASDSDQQVNVTFSGDQGWPATLFHAWGTRKIAVDVLGNFVVTWQSAAQDGDGTGIYATKRFVTIPPAVTTDPASNVTASSATLNGSIIPNDLAVTVSFEYAGAEADLGTPSATTVPAFPSTLPVGTSSQPVSAAITGLSLAADGTPKTYYFRVRASIAGGTPITGEILHFETSNTAPTAVPDEFFVAPLRDTVLLPVENDTDPDPGHQAALTITDAGQTAGHSGQILVSNRTITFRGAGEHPATDTFSYTVADPVGATSTSTVTLRSFWNYRGYYSGNLVGDGVSTTGSLHLLLSGFKTFSLSLDWGGESFSVTGEFGLDGRCTKSFRLDQSLLLTLTIDTATNAITGVLTDGATSVPFSLPSPTSNPDQKKPSKGKFTSFINAPLPAGPAAPALQFGRLRGASASVFFDGDGSVLITVAKPARRQNARFVGRMPDGEPFSAGSTLTSSGTFPVKANLYKKRKKPRGSVTSDYAFEVIEDPDFAGTGDEAFLQQFYSDVKWSKDAGTSDTYYPNSIDKTLATRSFFYRPDGTTKLPFFDPPAGLKGEFATLQVRMTGGDLPSDLVKEVLYRPGKPIIIASNSELKLKLKVNPLAGDLSGSFLFPAVAAPVPRAAISTKFRGVFELFANEGRAVFRGPAHSGKVTVTLKR